MSKGSFDGAGAVSTHLASYFEAYVIFGTRRYSAYPRSFNAPLCCLIIV